MPKNFTTSLNILRDIFTACYHTHACISALYSDLETIQHALTLHIAPHHDMNLIQCRQVLIHHLVTGACADHISDVNSCSRLNHSTCRAVAQDFDSAASMSAAVLDIILTADHSKISTEHLCHVAAALNISTLKSSHNLRFKIKAAICKHLLTIESATIESRSFASVADFFDSFEAHQRPVLLSIAALHRVELPEKPTTNHIYTAIKKHILSGLCSQFSHSHLLSSLPPDISIPDCVDVYNEWRINTIDLDLQVHILTAIHGSKTSLNPMRCILTNLDIEHQSFDPLRVLHKKLQAYILVLRKGKHIKHEQQALYEKTTCFNEQLEQIHESWLQLVPQVLKDKIIKLFHERTLSEALTNFTCALCAKAVPLISQCSLSLDMFNTEIIKQPDRRLNDDLVLERYKWLHPECVLPPIPLDGNGVLNDLLLDPDGVSFPSDGSPPLLSLCSVCHSSLKNNKLSPLTRANKLFLGPVSDELKDLTVIEEAMIARCCSMCWIVQLRE